MPRHLLVQLGLLSGWKNAIERRICTGRPVNPISPTDNRGQVQVVPFHVRHREDASFPSEPMSLHQIRVGCQFANLPQSAIADPSAIPVPHPTPIKCLALALVGLADSCCFTVQRYLRSWKPPTAQIYHDSARLDGSARS